MLSSSCSFLFDGLIQGIRENGKRYRYLREKTKTWEISKTFPNLFNQGRHVIIISCSW